MPTATSSWRVLKYCGMPSTPGSARASHTGDHSEPGDAKIFSTPIFASTRNIVWAPVSPLVWIMQFSSSGFLLPYFVASRLSPGRSAQVVKPLGIVAQQVFLCVERKVFAVPQDRRRFGPAHVPVRVVRRVHQRFGADLIDHEANHFFFGLAAIVAVFTVEIFARLLLAQRRLHFAAFFPLFVHALGPVGQPAATD